MRFKKNPIKNIFSSWRKIILKKVWIFFRRFSIFPNLGSGCQIPKNDDIASFFLKGSESNIGIDTHLKIDGSSPIRGVGWKTGYLAVSTARKLSGFEVFDPKNIILKKISSPRAPERIIDMKKYAFFTIFSQNFRFVFSKFSIFQIL